MHGAPKSLQHGGWTLDEVCAALRVATQRLQLRGLIKAAKWTGELLRDCGVSAAAQQPVRSGAMQDDEQRNAAAETSPFARILSDGDDDFVFAKTLFDAREFARAESHLAAAPRQQTSRARYLRFYSAWLAQQQRQSAQTARFLGTDGAATGTASSAAASAATAVGVAAVGGSSFGHSDQRFGRDSDLHSDVARSSADSEVRDLYHAARAACGCSYGDLRIDGDDSDEAKRAAESESDGEFGEADAFEIFLLGALALQLGHRHVARRFLCASLLEEPLNWAAWSALSQTCSSVSEVTSVPFAQQLQTGQRERNQERRSASFWMWHFYVVHAMLQLLAGDSDDTLGDGGTVRSHLAFLGLDFGETAHFLSLLV
ncbi:MAG: hypothetical protein MHM6MM_008225, partial [Cercozoa sp. M6MM]